MDHLHRFDIKKSAKTKTFQLHNVHCKIVTCFETEMTTSNFPYFCRASSIHDHAELDAQKHTPLKTNIVKTKTKIVCTGSFERKKNERKIETWTWWNRKSFSPENINNNYKKCMNILLNARSEWRDDLSTRGVRRFWNSFHTHGLVCVHRPRSLHTPLTQLLVFVSVAHAISERMCLLLLL